MAWELHMCLVRYFLRLERLDDKWKELSKKAEKSLEGLANRTEQLRHVTKLGNLSQRQNESNSSEEPPISMKLGSFDAFLRKMKESDRKKSGTALRSEILGEILGYAAPNKKKITSYLFGA
ncbi:hypothetical protein G5I_03761 [Acromyrmex echinatior]|uniref:Uncharacterized protein n=1 Tax=Acromyrmex echinatior TaxID=103372 RepID=F4WDU4_ACREC|nr:hypothetical protein G5I_03761 [Acromyrmex echinatior]